MMQDPCYLSFSLAFSRLEKFVHPDCYEPQGYVTKLRELDDSGVKNEDQSNTAFLVYMDLCEVKGWWNVHLHPSTELNLVFISGYPTRGSPRELVLPVLSSDTFTTETLQQYLHTLQLEGYKTQGITLAVCDTDSTTVYYKITNGLVQPDPPEVTEVKKQQRAERFHKKRCQTLDSVNKYMEKKSRLSESESRMHQRSQEIITDQVYSIEEEEL